MKYFAYSQREFVYKYVVMLSDTDQFQHMSFANYLRLMFLATDALFLNHCDPEFLSQHRLALVESRMQFKKQTLAGDQILIKLNSANVIEDQLALLYTFVIENSGELVSLGRQVYKIRSTRKDTSLALPEDLRQLVKTIEVNEEHLIYKY